MDSRPLKRQKGNEILWTCNMCCDFYENIQVPNAKQNRLLTPINFDINTNPLIDGTFFAVNLEYFQESISKWFGLTCTINSTGSEYLLAYQDDEGLLCDKSLVLTLINSPMSKYTCLRITEETCIEFRGLPKQPFLNRFETMGERSRFETNMMAVALRYFGKPMPPPSDYHFCPALPRMLTCLVDSPALRLGFRDTISCFTSEKISRLCGRSGVARSFEHTIIESIRGTICVFIENTLCSASIRAFHQGNLRFVTAADIQLSLKEQFGIVVYGCGINGRPPSHWTEIILEVVKQRGHKPFSVEALSVVNDLMTSQMDRILEVAKTLPNKSALRGQKLQCAFFDDTFHAIRVTFFEFADLADDGKDDFGGTPDDAAGDAPVDDAGGSMKFFQMLGARTIHADSFVPDEAILSEEGQRVYRGKAKVLSNDDITAAARLHFTEYAGVIKAALSFADKALGQFRDSGDLSMQEAKATAGLLVDPLFIALLANSEPNQVFLTPDASVYLAALLEIVLEEVIESVNSEASLADRQVDDVFLSPRHVFRALERDLDWNPIFLRSQKVHGIIKGGGTKDIPLPPRPTFLKLQRPFEKAFLDFLSTNSVLIDPRDGKHKTRVNFSGSIQAIEVPELDACCLQSQNERMVLARGALSSDIMRLLVQEERNHRDQHQYDYAVAENNRTDHIFEPLAFKFLMAEKALDFTNGDGRITAEAVDILQVATEAYMISIISTAVGKHCGFTLKEYTWARDIFLNFHTVWG